MQRGGRVTGHAGQSVGLRRRHGWRHVGSAGRSEVALSRPERDVQFGFNKGRENDHNSSSIKRCVEIMLSLLHQSIGERKTTCQTC